MNKIEEARNIIKDNPAILDRLTFLEKHIAQLITDETTANGGESK